MIQQSSGIEIDDKLKYSLSQKMANKKLKKSNLVASNAFLMKCKIHRKNGWIRKEKAVSKAH